VFVATIALFKFAIQPIYSRERPAYNHDNERSWIDWRLRLSLTNMSSTRATG